MKKPIYNEFERLLIRNNNTLSASLMLLDIATLRFKRAISNSNFNKFIIKNLKLELI